MKQKELIELLKQDIEDIKGLIDYEKYGLSEDLAKNQARAIVLNLKDHLKELIQK